jgi:hypothetical protein
MLIYISHKTNVPANDTIEHLPCIRLNDNSMSKTGAIRGFTVDTV